MTSAVKFLHDALVTQFDKDATDIEVVFGFKAPERHAGFKARVVVVPGDGSSNVGAIVDLRKIVKTTQVPVLYSTWLSCRLFLDAPEARGSTDDLLHMENVLTVRDAVLRALKLNVGPLWQEQSSVYAGAPGTKDSSRKAYMGIIMTIAILDDTVDQIPQLSWVHSDGELTVDELDQEVVTDVP